MIINKITCDHCKGNVDVGVGYSVWDTNSVIRIVKISDTPEAKEKHYCGKGCLMLALTKLIDEIIEVKGLPF